MEYKFPAVITRDLIESKVSQETLMYTYYGQPVKKGLFRSKVRNDSKPTVAYYKNRMGRIIIKDFGSNYCGDWVYVVMNKYGCGYYKALNIVASDIGLIPRQNNIPQEIKYSNTKLEDTTDAIIQVEIKDFEQYELDWWAKFGIDLRTLNKFKVFSCKNVFLNNNLFHLFKDKQLVFGYYGGIREDIERWRIYFPGNIKYKFISNWKSFRLQGAHALPKNGGEYLVVTKSLKDVMTLYSCDKIPAIAPISENCFLTEAQYAKLKSKFNKIILFYDNDLAGIENMNKIRKKFPDVHVLFIPRHYKAKDISDFYKMYGRTKTLELIEKAKNYVSEKENRSIL